MAINLNDNIAVLGAKPTDARYLDNLTPYADVNAVNTAIAANKRYTGLTVNVGGVEYWYKDGILDGNLVQKESNIATVGLTGATNGLTKVGQDVILGGALTGSTEICGASNTLNLGTAGSTLASLGAITPIFTVNDAGGNSWMCFVHDATNPYMSTYLNDTTTGNVNGGIDLYPNQLTKIQLYATGTGDTYQELKVEFLLIDLDINRFHH